MVAVRDPYSTISAAKGRANNRKRRKGSHRKCAALGPTAERVAKGDLQEQAFEGVSVHRLKAGFFESYKGKWPDAEAAFSRLLNDSTAADITGVTSNFNPSGIRTAGPRHGGLGDARARKVHAYARFNWVMDGLTKPARQVCDFLILQKPRADGRPYDLEAVGALFAPHLTSPVACKYFGLGALVVGAGSELIRLYAEFDMRERVKTVVGESRE